MKYGNAPERQSYTNSDIQQIIDSIDIVDLVSQSTTLSKSLNGPCPMCGGRDRFYIRKDRRHFGCRKCGFNGDAIDYACQMWHMTFVEALDTLSGRKTTPAILRMVNSIAKPQSDRPKSNQWMSYGWQERTLLKIARMRSTMRHKDNPGKQYLMARGITEQSIIDFQIGYNESCFDPSLEQGRPAVSLPYLMSGDTTLGVKYRYIDNLCANKDSRFIAEKGGNPILFGLHLHDPDRHILIASEGELNAISLRQACPEANCLSFGSEAYSEGLRQIVSTLSFRHSLTIIWMDDPVKLAKVIKSAPHANIVGISSIKTGRWHTTKLMDANDVLVSKGLIALRTFVLGRIQETIN